MGIDITINSTTVITLLKTRQNYFEGLFNAVNRVYIYEPLIGQEILKRFDLDILRFFKIESGNKIENEIAEKLIVCGLIRKHSGGYTLLCSDVMKIIKELKG